MTGDPANADLRRDRALCVVAAVVVLGFHWLTRRNEPGSIDPLEHRLVLAGAFLALAAGSYVHAFVRRHLTLAFHGLAMVYAVWIVWTIHVNHFGSDKVMALFALVLGTSLIFRHLRPLAAYLGVVACAVVAAVLLAHRPETPPLMFLARFSALAVAILVLVGWRDRALRRAREERERYRRLFDSNPVPIVVHVEERIVDANAAALQLVRAPSVDAVRGRPIGEFISPPEQPSVIERIRKRSPGEPGEPIELTARRLDGSYVECEVRGSPTVHEGRAATQVVIVDISERRRVERLQEDFVSAVSHELRTPLTSIHGSLSLLEANVGGELSEKSAQLVQLAKRNTGRLRGLIDDLLDLRKIEAGRLSFHFEDADLVPLVAEQLADLRPLGSSRGVQVSLDSHVDTAPVTLDVGRFEQVLTNLASNAFKHAPEGSSVDVAIRAAHDGFEVSVRDRGPGVPPEFVPRLFDKFSQADGDDARRSQGTGLGLSIAHEIVAQHDGELRYAGAEDGGATFTIWLPRRR